MFISGLAASLSMRFMAVSTRVQRDTDDSVILRICSLKGSERTEIIDESDATDAADDSEESEDIVDLDDVCLWDMLTMWANNTK